MDTDGTIGGEECGDGGEVATTYTNTHPTQQKRKHTKHTITFT